MTAAAGGLLIGGPIWYYLLVHHYPFARAEAFVLPLAAALVGAAVATLGKRLGGWLGTLSFAALLYVFLDLQTDLHLFVRAVVLLAVCIAISQLLRAWRATLACLTLSVFYLAGLPSLLEGHAPQGRERNERAAVSLPLVVHLILDEQWGIGGFRAAGDSVTAAFLEEFYLNRGFEVYPAAYSRWSASAASIPYLVSLGQPQVIDSVAAERFRPHINPYFERLRERGYRISVHQSSYIDFCHTVDAPVDACAEVPGNSVANFAYSGVPWTQRAVLAGRYFLNVTSHVYRVLHPDDAVWRRSGVGGGLRELAGVRDDIGAGSSAGRMIFMHVLLPHRPIEVDAECRIHSDPAKHVGYGEGLKSDSALHVHMQLYAAQTRCVHRELAQVISAVDNTAGAEGAIIIVHGDHGSRLYQLEAEVTLSEWDVQRLNAAFSTLLAIRRPGVPAAIHPEPVPIQDFLWNMIRSDFLGSDPGGWRHFVRRRSSVARPPDTLRALNPSEMLWARTDTPTTSSGDRARLLTRPAVPARTGVKRH